MLGTIIDRSIDDVLNGTRAQFCLASVTCPVLAQGLRPSVVVPGLFPWFCWVDYRLSWCCSHWRKNTRKKSFSVVYLGLLFIGFIICII
jgi:hypothetical protein